MKTIFFYLFLVVFLLLMRCNYPFEPVVEEDDDIGIIVTFASIERE